MDSVLGGWVWALALKVANPKNRNPPSKTPLIFDFIVFIVFGLFNWLIIFCVYHQLKEPETTIAGCCHRCWSIDLPARNWSWPNQLLPSFFRSALLGPCCSRPRLA